MCWGGDECADRPSVDLGKSLVLTGVCFSVTKILVCLYGTEQVTRWTEHSNLDINAGSAQE